MKNCSLDSRLAWLSDADNASRLRRGLRGLEKESLRVDRRGYLARTLHPRSLGSALTHPYLTTDYSEALPELVTPPYPSNWEALQFLCDLHIFVATRMQDELLWAQSMPCRIPSGDNVPIATYGSSNLGRMKSVYRRGLGFRYGRAMQTISGVHFNYSVPLDFWKPYKDREESSRSLRDFVSHCNMGAIRNYRRLAWLLIYLYGASPAFCKSFPTEGSPFLQDLDAETLFAPYGTSLRMSDIGYRNRSQSELRISVNSLDDYLAGIVAAVTTSNVRYEAIGVLVDGVYRQLNANTLQIEAEYYSPIRPKPPADSAHRPTVALREEGVAYLEVRTLDLNMLDPAGINQMQLRFVEALLIYCLLTDSPAHRFRRAGGDRRQRPAGGEGRAPSGTGVAARGTYCAVDPLGQRSARRRSRSRRLVERGRRRLRGCSGSAIGRHRGVRIDPIGANSPPLAHRGRELLRAGPGNIAPTASLFRLAAPACGEGGMV